MGRVHECDGRARRLRFQIRAYEGPGASGWRRAAQEGRGCSPLAHHWRPNGAWGGRGVGIFLASQVPITEAVPQLIRGTAPRVGSRCTRGESLVPPGLHATSCVPTRRDMKTGRSETSRSAGGPDVKCRFGSLGGEPFGADSMIRGRRVSVSRMPAR